MSRAIANYPDHSCFPGRRTKDGQFLLTPTEVVRNAVLYIAVHFARKYNIALLCFVIMSNHYHLLVDDPDGRISDFLQQFHGFTGIALNIHHFGTMQGLFWGRGKPSKPYCVSKHDMLRKCIYAVLNVIKAGIAPTASLWPGYLFGPEHIGKPFLLPRPTMLDGYPNAFPDVHEFTVPIPADYAHLPEAHVRAHFLRERLKAEEKARTERGDKPYLTTDRALRMVGPQHSTPEPKSDINPLFVAGTPDSLKAQIQRRKKFLKDHKEARKADLAGDTDIIWPAGTVAMHFRHGKPRHPSPQRRVYRPPPPRGPPT